VRRSDLPWPYSEWWSRWHSYYYYYYAKEAQRGYCQERKARCLQGKDEALLSMSLVLGEQMIFHFTRRVRRWWFIFIHSYIFTKYLFIKDQIKRCCGRRGTQLKDNWHNNMFICNLCYVTEPQTWEELLLWTQFKKDDKLLRPNSQWASSINEKKDLAEINILYLILLPFPRHLVIHCNKTW